MALHLDQLCAVLGTIPAPTPLPPPPPPTLVLLLISSSDIQFFLLKTITLNLYIAFPSLESNLQGLLPPSQE